MINLTAPTNATQYSITQLRSCIECLSFVSLGILPAFRYAIDGTTDGHKISEKRHCCSNESYKNYVIQVKVKTDEAISQRNVPSRFVEQHCFFKVGMCRPAIYLNKEINRSSSETKSNHRCNFLSQVLYERSFGATTFIQNKQRFVHFGLMQKWEKWISLMIELELLFRVGNIANEYLLL